MSDLISREDAINAIIKQDGIVDKSVAKRILIQLPSAEKTGKWIKDFIVLTSNPPKYRWSCSECGYPKNGFSVEILEDHCPACGARMEVME